MSVEVENLFLDFLEAIPKNRLLLDDVIQKNQQTLLIDTQDVHDFSEKLYMKIMQRYGEIIPHLNKAVENFSLKTFNKKINNVSFYNLDFVYKIRDLKSEKLGQLVSFSGTATRTTQVRPELVSGTFICK